MEQDRAVKVPAQAAVWAEGKVRVEAEWEGHLPQGPAEIAYVRAAIIQNRILLGNPVIKKPALNVVRQ